MKALFSLALPLALVACDSGAPDTVPPAALVTTVQPHQGEATRWVTAYGAATPASNGIATLSIQQPGQIQRLEVTPGSPVRAGQPILIFALAPSAQANYEAAVSALNAAREQRATASRLLAQQLATRDQLAQADKALADAVAALAAAKREGGGQTMQVVRSPFEGVVATIPVAQGDRTQPGAPLATVARNSDIVVTVGINPEDRPRIRAGQPARLQSMDGGARMAGHVLRVDGQLNANTKLIDVDLGIPPGTLLNGQPMKAEIGSGAVKGWIVPHESVVNDDAGAHVFQIVGGKAKAIAVEILQAGDHEDIISGPIAANRPLIVAGAYQIEDSGAVRTKN